MNALSKARPFETWQEAVRRLVGQMMDEWETALRADARERWGEEIAALPLADLIERFQGSGNKPAVIGAA